MAWPGWSTPRAMPGRPVAGLLERLREQSLADAGELAPGLDVGLAGIAWVLAEHGHADEAKFLLAAADAGIRCWPATPRWDRAGEASAWHA